MLGAKKVNLGTMVDMRDYTHDSTSFARVIPKSGCNKCPEKKAALQHAAVRSAPEAVPPMVHEVLRSTGQPLDRETLAFMEPRFGFEFSQVQPHSAVPQSSPNGIIIGPLYDGFEHQADLIANQVIHSQPQNEVGSYHHFDFSGIRIHSDSQAAESAKSINARAYTVGQNIVFGAGQYSPQTISGQHLLAHELAHTIQQNPQVVKGVPSANESGNVILQRAANPISIAVLAVLAAIAACGLPFHNYALREYEGKSDKWRHCWVSCEMSKTCGPALAELAGLGKEIRDRAVAAFCDYYPTSDICLGGHGDFMDSLGDLAANQACIPWETSLVGPLARLWRQSCKDCCDASRL